MAYTEAQLVAQLDSAAQGRVATIERLQAVGALWEAYVVGVTAPYAGRSRWVRALDMTNNTAAGDAAVILAALTQ